jgi:hypothetical protein
MGSGGIFQRGRVWYVQYRDPDTRRNVQFSIRSELERVDKLELATIMADIYSRRLEKIHAIIAEIERRPDYRA